MFRNADVVCLCFVCIIMLVEDAKGNHMQKAIICKRQPSSSDFSRRYINCYHSDVFSVVNMYLDHLKFCVVLMVEDMSVVVNVMLSLMSVMSPPPALCNLSMRTVVKVCTLGFIYFGGSLVS